MDQRRAEIAEFNDDHAHPKRAIALTPVKFGISFNLTAFNQAGALVLVYKDGSVLINHGGTEMGQGLHTKMSRSRPPRSVFRSSKVRMAPTRTDKVPNTSATAASSGADLNGGAVKNACEQIRARLELVARQLGVPPPKSGSSTGVVGLGKRSGVAWRSRPYGVLPARAAVRGRLLPHRGPALGLLGDARLAVQVLRLRRRGDRGRGGRLHRRLHHAPGRHRARRRRQPLAVDRPRSDRGRLRPGRRLLTLEDLRLDETTARPRPAVHPGGQHLQAAELLRDARRSSG